MTKTYTFAIAILALALSGCGLFDTQADPTWVEAPDTFPATVATTAPAEPTFTTAPAVAPTRTVNTRYINIGPVLDKLNEMGCTVEKLELREVSRGGNVSITCTQQIDPLNAASDQL